MNALGIGEDAPPGILLRLTRDLKQRKVQGPKFSLFQVSCRSDENPRRSIFPTVPFHGARARPRAGPARDPRALRATAHHRGPGRRNATRLQDQPKSPHVALSRPAYLGTAVQSRHLGQGGVWKRPLGPRGATLGGPLAEKRPLRRAQNATQVYCSPAPLYKTVSWPTRAM